MESQSAVEVKTSGNILTHKEKLDMRKGILSVEARMKELGGLVGDSPEYLARCPLKHTFADGAYIRELFMPKGMLFVTKIHKIAHPYFLMRGDCSILTEDGVKRIKGPFHDITPAGTKRIIYTHEDTIWVTVHVTKETDLRKIEDEIIAKTYDDLKETVIDVEAFVTEVSNQEERSCLAIS